MYTLNSFSQKPCERCKEPVGKPGRARCEACLVICRVCDKNPTDGGSYTRTCDECRTKCSKCGKPGMASRTLCSACHMQPKTDRENAAIAALPPGCARCGILAPNHWDHVNDDGRSYYSSGGKFKSVKMTMREELLSIIATGKSDILQRLCANCNWLKAYDRAAYDAPPTYGPL